MRKVVLVAALGYFIDILDLFLFSVLRVPSLKALGVPDDRLLAEGIVLLNSQMAGLLVGAVFWGVLGDRKGRVSVLYASILLYSLATGANALVATVGQYAVLRFIAGLGLAGELGVAITLVCETLPTHRRGLGTTLVAGVGLAGGLLAASLAEWFSWKVCYLIGGGAGLLLFALRLGVAESPLFQSVVTLSSRGNLALLFQRPRRLFTLLQLILLGLPIWFVSGILIIFSPELAKELGIVGEPIRAAGAVFWSYLGITIGDFLCGLLSQALRSRKRAVAVFLVALALAITLYLRSFGLAASTFHVVCFILGLGTGYWAVLVTMASEHFGTDLRATVTTLVPNLVRASVVPMSMVFQRLLASHSKIESAAFVGGAALLLAMISLALLEETFSKSLSFTEGAAHVRT